MDWNLFWLFVIFNIINVIIQTVKSIATIKCNKYVASTVNAIAYGLYTYIVVLTVCELPIWLKVLVVGLANLVGVFVVKLCEEKARKDKLWKIETSVDKCYRDEIIYYLKSYDISFNYIDNIGNYTIFNIFCPTQEDSATVKILLDKFKAKYFVSESKIL